jgi:hypothetical protein
MPQSVWGASNVRSDDENLGGDFEFLPKNTMYNTNY